MNGLPHHRNRASLKRYVAERRAPKRLRAPQPHDLLDMRCELLGDEPHRGPLRRAWDLLGAWVSAPRAPAPED